MPQQHFTELMNRNHGNGQWLTPEEAKTSGLIDTIFTADSVTNRTEAPSLHTDLSELPLTFNLNDSTMTIKQHGTASSICSVSHRLGKTHPTTAPAAAEPAGTAALTSSFAEDTIDVSAVTALPSLENCIREIASLKAQGRIARTGKCPSASATDPHETPGRPVTYGIEDFRKRAFLQRRHPQFQTIKTILPKSNFY